MGRRESDRSVRLDHVSWEREQQQRDQMLDRKLIICRGC
jgi:hypothetical protein